MEIVLEPDLSHCIQTKARIEYDRVTRELLAAEETDPLLSERVEILRSFLESTDFVKLRRQYEPYLVEGKRVRFTLRAAIVATEYVIEVT